MTLRRRLPVFILMKAVLEAAGAKVTIAENGSDAVIKLIETPAMGDVVNLRQARKQKIRAKAEKDVRANGARSGARRPNRPATQRPQKNFRAVSARQNWTIRTPA